MANDDVPLTRKSLFSRRALCNVICGIGDEQKTGWFLGGHYDFGRYRRSRGELYVKCTTESCCKGKRLQLALDGGMSGCIFTIRGFEKHAGRETNKSPFYSIKVVLKEAETKKKTPLTLKQWMTDKAKATQQVPVGTKIDVLWPARDKSYRGEVTGYGEDDLCDILYPVCEDNDNEEFETGINLATEMYRIVKPAVPPGTPLSFGSGMKSSQLLAEEGSSEEDIEDNEDDEENGEPGATIEQEDQGLDDLGQCAESDGNKIPRNKGQETDEEEEEDVQEDSYQLNTEMRPLLFASQIVGEEEDDGDEEIIRPNRPALRKRPARGPLYKDCSDNSNLSGSDNDDAMEEVQCDPKPALTKKVASIGLPPIPQPPIGSGAIGGVGGSGLAAAPPAVGQGQEQDEEFNEEYEIAGRRPKAGVERKRRHAAGADLGEKKGGAKRRLPRVTAQRGTDADGGTSFKEGGKSRAAKAPGPAPTFGRQKSKPTHKAAAAAAAAREVFSSTGRTGAFKVPTMPKRGEAAADGGGNASVANPLPQQQQQQQQQPVHSGAPPVHSPVPLVITPLIPTFAFAETPIASPPPPLQMQNEIWQLLQHTPGLSLSSYGYAFFPIFLACDAETRWCHFSMLRDLAKKGNFEGIRIYVETAVDLGKRKP